MDAGEPRPDGRGSGELHAGLRIEGINEPFPVPHRHPGFLETIEISTWRSTWGDIDVLRGIPAPGREVSYDEMMGRAESFPLDLPRDLFRGKVAVITGASRGLGAGLAERFAQLGVRLGLCARNEPSLPAGVTGITRSVDVTDAAALDRFARDVAADLGPIDLWVNNAGVLEPMGPLRTLDAAEIDRALLVNVGGVANGSATFARLSRKAPAGRRVLANITSGAARSVYAGWSIYGATKAAVDHLTEIVAAEEPDLVCHAVAPGVVDTDMQALIRTHDEADFPAIDRFRELHENGEWNSPTWIADHLLALLAGTLTPDAVVYRVPNQPR